MLDTRSGSRGSAAILPEGAFLVPDFVTVEREGELLREIDRQTWITELRRRVQHYGWRYDYRARSVHADSKLGAIPGWLEEECARLSGDGWFEALPDQVIVNEYRPGQGIAAHVDCIPCFGPVIASLTLGSRCEIVFTHRTNGKRRACILAPRGLLVFSGPARFDWTHAIPPRKSDLVDGQRHRRGRRVSLTYRSVPGFADQ